MNRGVLATKGDDMLAEQEQLEFLHGDNGSQYEVARTAV